MMSPQSDCASFGIQSPIGGDPANPVQHLGHTVRDPRGQAFRFLEIDRTVDVTGAESQHADKFEIDRVDLLLWLPPVMQGVFEPIDDVIECGLLSGL